MSSEIKAQFCLKLPLFIPPPYTLPKVWFKVHPCHTDTHLAPWGRCPFTLHLCSWQQCLCAWLYPAQLTPTTPPSCAPHLCAKDKASCSTGGNPPWETSPTVVPHGEICVRSRHGVSACNKHSSTRLTAPVPPSHLIYIQPSGLGWTAFRKP